jgi:hypothetical protein
MNLFFLKKYKSIILLFGLTYFSNTIQGQVEFQCYDVDDNGMLTIMIWNSNQGKRYKLDEAKKDAINILIYKGLSLGENCSSQFNVISSEEELERFKIISASFFTENGDWSNFVGVSTSGKRPSGDRIKEKWAVYTLKLSRLELKKYLQKKDVIRNLNSGF